MLDVTDFISEFDRYKESEEVNDTLTEIVDTIQPILDHFILNGVEVNSIFLNNKRMIPEQFGSLSNEKYTLNRIEDTVQYYNWKFKDSLHTMNAFFNWMDNFGKNGRTIKIGEEKNVHTAPFIIYVGDTNILFIESTQNFDEEIWDNYFESIGMNNWSYFLKQNKRSKVRWYEFLEGEKVKMTK